MEGVMTEMPITTAKEKAQRRLEVKARSNLMMGIPNEHQLKFNSIKDAKKLLEAVEKRFGGNAATRKTQRNLLKQQYETFTATNSEMLDQNMIASKLAVHLGAYGMKSFPQEDYDIEEIDLRWQMAMLTMKGQEFLRNTRKRKLTINGNETNGFDKSKVNAQNCHKRDRNWLGGNFMPPTPDLSFTRLDEFVNELVVENCKAMSSEEEPKLLNETNGILKSFVTGIKNLVDHKVKVIRYDNGTEFKNKEMNQFCEMNGILRQFSIARTPQQNGVAERRNKTLNEAARTMLVDSNKAFRVFNSRTRIVEENLHIKFSDSTPNVVGTKVSDNADPKSSHDDGFKPSSDDEKNVDEDPRKDSECKDQDKEDNVNNTNNVNTVSSTVNADGTNEVNVIGGKTRIELPFDPNMHALEDVSIFDFTRDDEDDGVVADMNNLDTTIQEEPKKVIHALKDPSWIEAMQEELLQFKLVAQGYTQEEGIDYDEVFSPVARIEAIRLFLAYASFKDFVMYQMDVKSVFLYGKIEKEVYVCQPPGFNDPNFPDRVYKVEKALYGLHQAPRAWYETLSTYLLDYGFQRGKINKILFIKRHKGDILLVQVYVDDIIFGSTKKELCIAFEKLMHEKFQMSSMGELTFFLGLQVKQKKDDVFISQDIYIAKILKKFRFTEVKTASTPMETQKPLLKDEDGEEVDVHMYRSMIGSLMYLTSSRPDIMFAVCACARYQVNPKVSHLHVVKRIFRYLKGQPKLRLWYLKDSPFDLVAYTDSDYAEASLDRKSTTGGCRFLGCRLISWQCKKQTVVVNSTTKAEYVAASSCYGQVLWIQNQLFDYGYALTINPTIYISCIEQFWSTVMAKTINEEEQLHALVDGKKIIITESSVRRDLQLADEKGVDYLPNSTIFEQLTLMGKPKRKDTQVTQPSDPIENVADEAVHKELGDSLVRDATTASSLEAEQDSGNINKTQSQATPNESSSQGTNSGGGPWCQETMGDTIAQTRFESCCLVCFHTTTTATIKIVDDITLAQALEEMKSTKPKKKGFVIKDLGESTTTISSQLSSQQSRGNRLNEETALNLQAEFDEEERLAREKAEKEEEANIALIET
ncbi:putative ribonuclease H-like domain-containing protein [Tanacetum coccineum]